ncbi:plasmid mobilization relaxosome protein MobC [Pseudoxanthomonas sp. SGD-10]|nr:plasmid mobilization relaxosome protein MobC [Pseudoxanthomonas sp. SGD-10]
MKNMDDNRTIRITIRFTKAESERIEKKFGETRFLSRTEYLRNMILNRKIISYYRNQSLDEVMEELILLRQELNFVGHNFNQAVRKLNAFAEMPDAETWKAALSCLKNQIEPKIHQIKDRIQNYAEIWSQKSSQEKV